MRIKKIVVIFALLFCSYAQAQMPKYVPQSASKIRYSVTELVGYTFATKFNFPYSYGRISDNVHYGIDAEMFINKYRSVDIGYLRMDSKLRFYDNQTNNQFNKNDKVGLNYITLGATNYFPVSDIFSPYFGLNIGVCVLTNKINYTAAKFSAGAKFGAKMMITDHFAIKLQADLQSIVQGVGGGIYIGSGGMGYGLNTYASTYQFGFTSGLTYDF